MRAAERWLTGEQHLMHMRAINKPPNACLFHRVHWGKMSTPSTNISQGKKCSLGSVGLFIFFLSELAFLAYLPLNPASKWWVLTISVCWIQWKTAMCYWCTSQFCIYWESFFCNDGNLAFRVGTTHCNQVWKRQGCAPERCPLLLSHWKHAFVLIWLYYHILVCFCYTVKATNQNDKANWKVQLISRLQHVAITFPRNRSLLGVV